MIGAVLRIRYELVQELGEDGLFTVYRARDRVAGKDVCVRVLQSPFAEEPAFVARLREIVDRVRGIQHPGIERPLDVDDDDGRPFVVSEFAPGQNLAARIRRLAPFSAPVAVQTMIAVCEAVEAIHAEGLVHGDLAARNVTVGADGSAKVANVALWQTYSASRFAGAAALPGMAPYLAPEISSGAMPSPSSDIYALGVLLFELLTGRTPYPGDTPVSIAVKHATAPPPTVRMFNPSVSTVLDEVVKKALAKTESDRYPSVRALLNDLRAVNDALRFGKNLSWPIGAAAASPRATAVAPRMGAVRPASKVQEPEEEPEARYSGDVPKWLRGLVYLAVIGLVGMLGGYVYLNLSMPKTVKVPDVVGLTANEASIRLQQTGLTLRISRREQSETSPEGTILDLSPRPGQDAKEGSTVLAILSSGSRFVEVPDLRGRTVDDAKSLLASLGLELDEPVVEVRHREVEAGKVVAQVPEPRRKVERFTRVRAEVSTGRSGPRSGSDPDGPRSLYKIRIGVPDEVDESILVRVDITDAVETRTIYEQRHTAGESIEVQAEGIGKEATFRVFFDGEVVKQVTQPAAVAE